MHHTPFRIGVFAFACDIAAAGRADFERYPSRSAPGRVCPAYLIVLYIGLRKLLDQKRKQILTIACRQGTFPPALLQFQIIHVHNKLLQTILPAFTIPNVNFRPLQPLREYGRLMGSDSHPRILRLAPLISGRIDYLRRSRVFRQ